MPVGGEKFSSGEVKAVDPLTPEKIFIKLETFVLEKCKIFKIPISAGFVGRAFRYLRKNVLKIERNLLEN